MEVVLVFGQRQVHLKTTAATNLAFYFHLSAGRDADGFADG